MKVDLILKDSGILTWAKSWHCSLKAKILDFCELDWEDNCLNFSKKSNPIKTVSVTQATKPIYKTSLKAYEKYNDYLDIFKKIENIKKNT